jgi:elongation factor Ts
MRWCSAGSCACTSSRPSPAPQGVTAADIPAAIVEKERKFRIEQAMESGKPKEIAEKMVEGGMRKFFEEIALLEQPFVMDPSKKIKDIVGPWARAPKPIRIHN